VFAPFNQWNFPLFRQRGNENLRGIKAGSFSCPIPSRALSLSHVQRINYADYKHQGNKQWIQSQIKRVIWMQYITVSALEKHDWCVLEMHFPVLFAMMYDIDSSVRKLYLSAVVCTKYLVQMWILDQWENRQWVQCIKIYNHVSICSNNYTVWLKSNYYCLPC